MLEATNAAAGPPPPSPPDDSTNVEEADVEIAVTQTGFGRFNIKVAVIGGLMYANTGLSIGSVGFILPAAACDLRLDTLAKGRVSTAPILGMVVGSYFWGCFADLQGRRSALLCALFAYALIEAVSSLVESYELFLLLKFFSGWFVNGQSAIGFTYLGEFQSELYREKILCWMEMAWTIGLIVLPLLGWAVIPLQFSYVSGQFAFRSWNLFIVVCAVPSLLIGLWLLSFPETPKYLAERRRNEELVETLAEMYARNTGGADFDEYLDKLGKSGNEPLRRRLALARQTGTSATTGSEKLADSCGEKLRFFSKTLRTILVQSTKLWKPPYLRSTVTACGIMYCIGSSYYALMLWFPEVFQRFAVFEKLCPDETASICTISSGNWTTNSTISDSFETGPVDCWSTIPDHVYLQTLILGLSCLPVGLALPLCVHKLGYNFYLVVSTAIAAIATVGFFFARSWIENLALSCIFEAFSSVCISTMLCIVVELFPSELRAMAAALSIFFARLGALVGNALFGYMMDDYCVTLISVVAGQLIAATVLSLVIPRKSINCNG